MQQIYNSSGMCYLWFAIKYKLKNEKPAKLQNNRDAEYLDFDGFIKQIFFFPTAAQYTVVFVNHLENARTEKK